MPEAAAPKPSHRSDIQGLRAVAVILVVLYHAAGFLPGGFIGVDVFFVVSGFVITGLLARELERSQGLRFGDFYARRVRRLLPALTFFLLVTLALSALILSPLGTQQAAGQTGRATSLFSANLYLYQAAGGYFDTASTLNPFLHMWSLAVEEQFYLIFPALTAALWWLGRRLAPKMAAAKFTGIALGAVAVITFGLSVVLTKRGVSVPGVQQPVRFAFYMSPSRAWEFLAGSLLALSGDRLQRGGVYVLRACSSGGMALVLTAALTYSDGTVFPGLTALLPVVGTALLLLGGATRASTFPGLSSKLMVWLGDVSYSWYLWHWPFVVFARVLVNDNILTLLAASILSLVPATVSYRFVEQPFRFGARWSGWKAVGLAAACIVLPLVGSVGLTSAANRGWGSASIQSVAQQNQLHADVLRGCDGGGVGHPGCVWTVPDASGLAVLLGDSNAGHFTEPVAQAAARLKLDLVVSTQHGCPFAEVLLARNQNDGADCLAAIDRAIEETISLKPRLVVLASASDLYIRESGTMHLRDGSGQTSQAGKADVWSEGLRRAGERFTTAGIAVLIVHPIPHFDRWGLNECSMITMLSDTNNCGIAAATATLDEHRSSAVSAERSVAISSNGISTVDFGSALCPQTVCVTNRGQEWIYRDSAHLSVPGSLTLTDRFADEMTRAIGP